MKKKMLFIGIILISIFSLYNVSVVSVKADSGFDTDYGSSGSGGSSSGSWSGSDSSGGDFSSSPILDTIFIVTLIIFFTMKHFSPKDNTLSNSKFIKKIDQMNLDAVPLNEINKYIQNKRLEHSKSVALLCYDIAKNNNIDPNVAYLAGLLHDIAKGIEPNRSEMLMNEYFPLEKKLIGKWAYHQFIGVLIAQDKFNISSKDILNSIEYHSTGRDKMSKLEKIVYVSDKLDPLRGWDSSSLINECKKDIDNGFIEVLNSNVEFFKIHNINYKNYFTEKCLKYYLGE